MWAAVILPKYCRYGVKHYIINQSTYICEQVGLKYSKTCLIWPALRYFMLKVTDYLRIFWTYDNLKQENVLEKMRFVLKI